MDLHRAVAVAVALCWAGAGGTAAAAEVRAIVRMEPPWPAPEPLSFNDAKSRNALKECGSATRSSQRLAVDQATGGVQDVAVWLEASDQSPRPAEPQAAILDQRDCLFVPHVLMAPLGARVAVRNADAVVHNVRIFEGAARRWEKWQQPRAADMDFPFSEPGRYLVRCGVHPWMYAWVLVTDAPHFGVTGSAGEVIMPSVPEGAYTVHVWHEVLGEAWQQVTVSTSPALVTVVMSQQKDTGG